MVDLGKIGAVIIYSKDRCMNSCLFCNGVNTDGKSEEEKFITAIKDSKYFIENGYDTVEISGGDPGEFSAIAEIVYYLKKNGIKYVQLSTHGRTLKDPELVSRLSKAGLDFCRIPLYGSTAEIHNRATQVNYNVGNAFEDTVLGIENCSKYGISVAGQTLITSFNKEDMNNIISLYIELTKGLLKEIVIGNIGISDRGDYNFTSDWYIPIKDLGPYLREVVHNHPEMPNESELKIIDIPYCSLGEYSEYLKNKIDYPDLGEHEIETLNQDEEIQGVPHYRVKKHFEECDSCSLKDICGGTIRNDMEMFGVEGMKAIK